MNTRRLTPRPYKIKINGAIEYEYTNKAEAMKKFNELSEYKGAYSTMCLYFNKTVKRYSFGANFQDQE
jgi:hypothetical protein